MFTRQPLAKSEATLAAYDMRSHTQPQSFRYVIHVMVKHRK